MTDPAGPASALIHVVRPGPCTTVQDLGRPGFGRFGVSPSGAMDPLAHRLANRLLRNPETAATLEITDAGAELELEAATALALAGADLGATLDGQPLAGADLGACVLVTFADRGARLRFTRRRRGARVYLAVPGGLEVPLLFGSAATDLGAGLGGLEGRPLRAGDRLWSRPAGGNHAPAAAGAVPGHRSAPGRGTGARAGLGARQPGPLSALDLTGILGLGLGGRAAPAEVGLRYVPDGDLRLGEAQARFPGRAFRVSTHSGRSGFRFEGRALPAPPDAQGLSEPTAAGAIQLPPDGLPILLMADRNPTGGYPRLGHLALVDRGAAAQLAPGDTARFLPVGAEQAMHLAREQEARFLAASRLLPVTRRLG